MNEIFTLRVPTVAFLPDTKQTKTKDEFFIYRKPDVPTKHKQGLSKSQKQLCSKILFFRNSQRMFFLLFQCS